MSSHTNRLQFIINAHLPIIRFMTPLETQKCERQKKEFSLNLNQQSLNSCVHDLDIWYMKRSDITTEALIPETIIIGRKSPSNNIAQIVRFVYLSYEEGRGGGVWHIWVCIVESVHVRHLLNDQKDFNGNVLIHFHALCLTFP